MVVKKQIHKKTANSFSETTGIGGGLDRAMNEHRVVECDL